ncbi:hypothetical protein D9M70_498770 [compost metagenome]
MVLYANYGIAQPTRIRMPRQKSDDALWNLTVAQIVMQLDHPGAQALKHSPIGFLALPLGAEERAPQSFMLVIDLLVVLIGEHRVNQLQHAHIGLRQSFSSQPLQTRASRAESP